MAQHLHEGSVVTYGDTYVNATVENITDQYLELSVPVTGGNPRIVVVPWFTLNAGVGLTVVSN